jgi:hypothetical protein
MHVQLRWPLSGYDSQQLLEFCLAQGADCFRVSFVSTDAHHDLTRDLIPRFEPYRLGLRNLERTVVYKGQSQFAMMECWALNSRTIGLILDSCGGSLSSYEFGRFPEDWTFYRDGELLVGIISHEQFAFVRPTQADREPLAALLLTCAQP